MRILICVLVITFMSCSYGFTQEFIVFEKPCTCGEHLKYYGQWGWCDCEEISCDKDRNCICVKPCRGKDGIQLSCPAVENKWINYEAEWGHGRVICKVTNCGKVYTCIIVKP